MEKQQAIKLLEKFKQNNKDKYEIEKIGIFGSVARGENNSLSDIDICIKTKKANLFAIVHIKEELEYILSNKIDIVRLRDTMNPYLKARIDKEAIYV